MNITLRINTLATILTMGFLGCSMNLDDNCLNPAASCFKPDTIAPTIASSTPATGATIQQNADIQQIIFSEPVRGAENPSSYAFGGLGGAGVVMSSIVKVDDRTYNLYPGGTLISGPVTLSFPGITDWGGNAVVGSLSFTADVGIVVSITPSGLPAGKFYVSNTVGGNLTQNLTWQADLAAEQYFVNIVPIASACPTEPASSNSTGTNATGAAAAATGIVSQIRAADMAGQGDHRVCIFVNKTSAPVKQGYGSVVFQRDDTLPVITAVAPATGASVSHTQVSYNLSEDCNTASITWTRTGGTADPGSPRAQVLTGTELLQGTKTAITLTNNPALVSGAIYSVAFNCADLSGNNAVTVTSTGVTYDTVNPVISAVAPASAAFVNSTQVSYTLSETIASGSITWTRTGGSADPGSPHVQALTGAELTAGTKTNITLTNNPTLVSGAVYSITFNATDAAGNTASPVTSTGVTYLPGPLILTAAQTLDLNNNGKIDTYRLTFSKTVVDITFPGYAANSLGGVTTQWLVAGRSNVRLLHGTQVSASSFGAYFDTANDNILYVAFDESAADCSPVSQTGCDTGMVPDLTTTATPGLQDLTGQVLSQVVGGTVAESDGAKPILAAAVRISVTTVDAILSEPVETATANLSGHYVISGLGNVAVSAAVRDGVQEHVVHLTTSEHNNGTEYTLTVSNNVRDLATNATNTEINGSTSLAANTATFTGINPLWARTIVSQSGGGGSTFNAVGIDPSGDVVVAGRRDGAGQYDFGGVTLDGPAGGDATLVKYDVTGTPLWARGPTNAPSFSGFNGVAVDSSGNIYAAGYQFGADTYTYGSGVTATGSSTGTNLLLVKYDSGGNALWARTTVSGVGNTDFSRVAVGGSAICAVSYQPTTTMDYGSGNITTNATSQTALVVRYNTDGAIQWARATQGGTQAYFAGVTVDSAGNCIVAGTQNGTFTYTHGGTNLVGTATGSNPILVKFNASGYAVWAKTTTGAITGGFNAVTVDGSDNIYVAGTQGAGSSNYGNGVAVNAAGPTPILLKYDVDGNAQWVSPVASGPACAGFEGITIDGSGNLYVGGMQSGDGVCSYGNGVDVQASVDTYNRFAIKYNTLGVPQWGRTTLLGDRTNFGGIAATASGYTYVTGTQRGDEPYSYAPGVFAQGPIAGTDHAVVVRYGP
jgi:hypothetical protein